MSQIGPVVCPSKAWGGKKEEEEEGEKREKGKKEKKIQLTHNTHISKMVVCGSN